MKLKQEYGEFGISLRYIVIPKQLPDYSPKCPYIVFLLMPPSLSSSTFPFLLKASGFGHLGNEKLFFKPFFQIFKKIFPLILACW